MHTLPPALSLLRRMAMFPSVLLAAGPGGSGAQGLHASSATAVSAEGTQASLWALLVGVPALCVAAQMGLWRGAFTLHGEYLKTVQAGGSSSSSRKQ
jgi:hypothetical protein